MNGTGKAIKRDAPLRCTSERGADGSAKGIDEMCRFGERRAHRVREKRVLLLLPRRGGAHLYADDARMDALHVVHVPRGVVEEEGLSMLLDHLALLLHVRDPHLAHVLEQIMRRRLGPLELDAALGHDDELLAGKAREERERVREEVLLVEERLELAEQRLGSVRPRLTDDREEQRKAVGGGAMAGVEHLHRADV